MRYFLLRLSGIKTFVRSLFSPFSMTNPYWQSPQDTTGFPRCISRNDTVFTAVTGREAGVVIYQISLPSRWSELNRLEALGSLESSEGSMSNPFGGMYAGFDCAGLEMTKGDSRVLEF